MDWELKGRCSTDWDSGDNRLVPKIVDAVFGTPTAAHILGLKRRGVPELARFAIKVVRARVRSSGQLSPRSAVA